MCPSLHLLSDPPNPHVVNRMVSIVSYGNVRQDLVRWIGKSLGATDA